MKAPRRWRVKYFQADDYLLNIFLETKHKQNVKSQKFMIKWRIVSNFTQPWSSHGGSELIFRVIENILIAVWPGIAKEVSHLSPRNFVFSSSVEAQANRFSNAKRVSDFDSSSLSPQVHKEEVVKSASLCGWYHRWTLIIESTIIGCRSASQFSLISSQIMRWIFPREVYFASSLNLHASNSMLNTRRARNVCFLRLAVYKAGRQFDWRPHRNNCTHYCDLLHRRRSCQNVMLSLWFRERRSCIAKHQQSKRGFRWKSRPITSIRSGASGNRISLDRFLIEI